MRIILTLVGLVLGQALAVAQNTALSSTQEMNRLHQDSKAYIARLEDPKRDAYQKPEEVVKALSIKEGEVIADIGAGSGYFTFRLARPVGEKGRVYAVDVSPDMILHLNRRVRDMKVGNVVTILCRRTIRCWPMPRSTGSSSAILGTTSATTPSISRCSNGCLSRRTGDHG